MAASKKSPSKKLAASRKKYRNLEVSHRAEKKASDTQELVLTLGADGEVVKVETLEKSGQRKALSEEEFAALAGEDEADDISPEEAYAAGLSDATQDEFDFELGEDDASEEEEMERFILREMVAGQLLRRGVRRIILRSLDRREAMRQRAQTAIKAAQESGHKAGSNHNGHATKQ